MVKSVEAAAKAFNIHDSAAMQDPFPAYAEFRDKCPIAHSDELGGFYFVTRYDAAKQVYADYRSFSSEEGTALPTQPVKMYPVDLDPPEQTRYRKILNPEFTIEVVGAHRARIGTIVEDLIDTFIEGGSADLLDQLVRPALSATVLPMLGVPLSDRRKISELLDYLVRFRTHDPEGCARVGGEVAAYLMGLAAERRVSEPKDDILQTLIGSKMHGAPLSDDQIFRVLIIILFGGLDTTSAALAEALLHIARKPDDGRRLLAGEAPWASAIEEFVRFASPVQGLRRTVASGVVVEGMALKPGDTILSMNGAANRDPDRFHDPDRCIIDRRMEEHLGFGAGAHICLGRNLARLEMEIIIAAVLTRLPDYSIAADFVPEYAVGEARGMKTLPVTFTPGSRVRA